MSELKQKRGRVLATLMAHLSCLDEHQTISAGDLANSAHCDHRFAIRLLETMRARGHMLRRAANGEMDYRTKWVYAVHGETPVFDMGYDIVMGRLGKFDMDSYRQAYYGVRRNVYGRDDDQQ